MPSSTTVVCTCKKTTVRAHGDTERRLTGLSRDSRSTLARSTTPLWAQNPRHNLQAPRRCRLLPQHSTDEYASHRTHFHSGYQRAQHRGDALALQGAKSPTQRPFRLEFRLGSVAPATIFLPQRSLLGPNRRPQHVRQRFRGRSTPPH